MNILHLKYAVEVEKTGSITQAAERLYMGQPNLSKAIHDLEESLGISIFKRTSKGVVPTQKGAEFLRYAKNVVNQIDKIESLYGKENEGKIAFSLSIPRASYITDSFAKFVSTLDPSKEIDINYIETNSVKTINNVVNAESNIGIVRYQTKHDSYYASQFNEKGLKHELIWDFEYLLLISEKNPLTKKEVISYEDLSNNIEIMHGDSSTLLTSDYDITKTAAERHLQKRIQVYERGSQFDILNQSPCSYMWVSPMPEEVLNRHGLVLRHCNHIDSRFTDILIYSAEYKLSSYDKHFLRILKSTVNSLNTISYK